MLPVNLSIVAGLRYHRGMRKKYLVVVALALLLGVMNFYRRPQQPDMPYEKMLAGPLLCMMPPWPKEALRYELESAAVVNFRIGLDGKVLAPHIVSSSGWKILDDAAIASVSQCQFKPDLEQAREGQQLPLKFVWTFDTPPPQRPQLTPESCAASPRYTSFSPADRRPSSADGVLLRFLVDQAGRPNGVVAEPNGQPQALVDGAIEWLQSCRFAYDSKQNGKRTDTVFGRVNLR